MKRGIIQMLASVILIIIVSLNANAQNIDKVRKAYQCLDELVNTTQINLDEAIFSVLANVPGNKSINAIQNEKSLSEWCWPKAGCNVKTTSQVAIAYNHLRKDTTNITNWLLSKNGTISGFSWFLQVTIDNSEVSQCKINYDNADHILNVDNEMKLGGNIGGCLTIDNNGYRMKISNNCVNKIFGVNCDKGYKINLLYEKSVGETLYVSSRTESGSANTWKSLDINAKCFKEGNVCNYESSLWATTALYDSNKNYQPFVPYLSVLSEDNQRLMPSSFLSYIEGGNQHFEKLIQAKFTRPQERAYWDVSENRFYDTALGILALGGCEDSGEEACTNPDLKDVANYLFDGQTDKGCWNNNNLKDTAFLLYSGWGQSRRQSGSDDGIRGGGTIVNNSGNRTAINNSGGTIVISEGGTCADIDGTCKSNCSITERTTDNSCSASGEVCCIPPEGYYPDSESDCEIEGYYCVEDVRKCLEDAGGEVYGEYDCNPYNLKCCSREFVEKTCPEQGGKICQNNEVCSNDVVDSSDGACCKDECNEDETFQCVDDNDCDDGVCDDGECVSSTNVECSTNDECGEGKICDGGSCIEKSKGSKTWIIILIVLIVIALFGIIFRNNIRMFLFAKKGKGKTGDSGFGRTNGPGGPGEFGRRYGFGPGLGRAPPRFGPPSRMRPMPPNIGRPPIRPSQVISKPPQVTKPFPTKKMSEKEKDMEETLKKLKKMAE